eukprot:759216-Hanusia_phi.AAC.1
MDLRAGFEARMDQKRILSRSTPVPSRLLPSSSPTSQPSASLVLLLPPPPPPLVPYRSLSSFCLLFSALPSPSLSRLVSSLLMFPPHSPTLLQALDPPACSSVSANFSAHSPSSPRS